MQQLNPLGSAGSWELAVVLSLATWSYVLLSSVIGQDRVSDGSLMILAVAVFTVAVVVNLLVSAPRSGMYRRFDYVVVVGLALGAALLQGFASAGGPASISTDWGPLALAGILAAASSFRPQGDQLWAGVSSAAVIAVQKIFEGIHADAPFGDAYFTLTAVAPIVIVTLGQAAYSGYAIRTLKAWRRGFEQTQASVGSLVGAGGDHSLGQELVASLSVEVQPLLARILLADRITTEDSALAVVASDRIRSRLVALSQQTWVERLEVTVSDPNRVADRFDLSARTAITALFSGMARQSVENIAVALTLVPESSTVKVEISGHFVHPKFHVRTQLAPIFRVLYVVFVNVRIAYEATSMTVQFEYGAQ